MRTFLLAAASRSRPSLRPPSAATRNFGVTGFEKVRVEGPFKVTLTTGVAPFAQRERLARRARPGRDRGARRTPCSSTPAVSSWGGYPGQDAGPVEIEHRHARSQLAPG